MKWKNVVLLLGVSLALLCPRWAASSMFLKRTLGELTREADAIVQARVVALQPKWVYDAQGRHIHTFVTFHKEAALVGDVPGDTFTLDVIGGTVGNITEALSDCPQFTRDLEAVLFLQANPLRVLPGPQGVYEISNGNVYIGISEVPLARFRDGLATLARNPSAQVDFTAPTKEAAGAPAITNITPTLASAGTNTRVTINGSGFGASQGTGHVDFFYQTGQPTIQASIVSWTDTKIVCTAPVGTVNGYPGSAASGPVTVTGSGGTSSGYLFRVSFGYGQTRWSGGSPVVDYKINENTADTTGEGAAVQVAAESWNNAGAKFAFRYAGSHTNTTASFDGVNEILWGSLPPGVIGMATYWYDASNNMQEADIVYNDAFDWTAGYPSGSQMDIQTISTHELGHWLSLRDLYGDIGDGVYDVAKVMYGYGSYGEVKRNLHADDQAGIQWIYGSAGPPPPTGHYYVTPNGSDSNPGKSWAQPLRSLGKALSLSSPGDEIWVRIGSYPEKISFTDRKMYGGFLGFEKSLADRTNIDPEKSFTLSSIDGQSTGRCVTITGQNATVLDGFNLTNGSSDQGGGLSITAGTVANCRIDGNLVQGTSPHGGGLYVNAGTAGVQVSHCVIVYNQAQGADAAGGGVFNSGGMIDNCQIDNNIAGGTLANGGGVYNQNSGKVANCVISDNQAAGAGGGVYNRASLLVSEVASNTTDGQGAGVYNATDALIDGCQIHDNVATGGGGGVYSRGRYVQNSLIHDNRGAGGGGVYLSDPSALLNCILYSNQSLGDGGGVYDDRSTGLMANCTVTDNTASGLGAGVYNDTGTIHNAIAWQDQGADIVVRQDALSGLWYGSVDYSCMGQYVGPEGLGNLFVDPEFVDPDALDFHIRVDSPCVDTGRFIKDLLTDFEGGMRPFDGDGLGAGTTGDGSDYDIGADEFQTPGLPILAGVTDNKDGTIKLSWDNRYAPPLEFLAFGYDIYLGQWLQDAGGSMWFPFAYDERAGLLPTTYTGGYHAWISSLYDGGLWLPCANPWTGITYGGAPHLPRDFSAEDLGSLKARLHWTSDIYGVWHYQAIAFETATGQFVPTIGPNGNSYWQFSVYPSPSYMNGTLDVTVPAEGDYDFLLRGMAWDTQTVGEFSQTQVSMTGP
ncbi:MAG: right-handed parallel beta-helix repeat-containing protein [Candidatus Sumerlaeota bacterium]|nr:right-handed parallel beta-helix repeat-containing protein [Candidatus Sumerlaeota bacterium]